MQNDTPRQPHTVNPYSQKSPDDPQHPIDTNVPDRSRLVIMHAPFLSTSPHPISPLLPKNPKDKVWTGVTMPTIARPWTLALPPLYLQFLTAFTLLAKSSAQRGAKTRQASRVRFPVTLSPPFPFPLPNSIEPIQSLHAFLPQSKKHLKAAHSQGLGPAFRARALPCFVTKRKNRRKEERSSVY